MTTPRLRGPLRARALCVRLSARERAALDAVAAHRGVYAADVVRQAIVEAARELRPAPVGQPARPEGAA